MIIPGHLALVHHSDDRDYAVGVYFLAQIIRETLSLAFFYKRLTAQLTSGSLHGIDYEQARFSHIACFATIVVNITKLIESKNNVWNYEQLYKVWRKYESDETKQRNVLAAINRLKANLKWVKDYRHTKVAHQTKDDEVTTLHVPLEDIDFLGEVVAVMDMFVDGTIPYGLYLHESSQEIDLRKELNL